MQTTKRAKTGSRNEVALQGDATNAHGTWKCLATASLCNMTVSAAPVSGAVALPAISVEEQVIFGANSVCKAIAAVAGGTLGLGNVDVEQWMDWDATVFEPVVAEFASFNITDPINEEEVDGAELLRYDDFSLVFDVSGVAQSNGVRLSDHQKALFTKLKSGLEKIEAALKLGNRTQLTGSDLTLADISLAITTQRIEQHLGSFPATQAWVQRVVATDAVQKTQAQTAEYSGVSNTGPVDLRRDGLLTALQGVFTQAIEKAFPQTIAENLNVANMARCQNPKFGDFQCNSPMNIAQRFGGTAGIPTGNIRNGATYVAQKLIDSLPADSNTIIESTSIAGPGFVNVKLNNSTIIDIIRGLLTQGPLPPNLAKKRVLVDFSSPNIAKDMHVGHLRSTIIGDSICRVLEFCDFDVMRVNHVGDWGTQFGMLIGYMQDSFPNLLESPPDLNDLTAIYKAAKKRFDEDPEFKKRSQLNVVKLQGGDPDCRAIWKLLCDISRREFQKVYDRLQVQLEEYGESYYNDMIPAVIQRLDDAGMLQIQGGAACVFVPGSDYPLILRKTDGGFGYDSTDMAALDYRVNKLHRDWVIILTDAGQSSHFQMIFDTGRNAGLVDPKRHRLDHIGFGVVCGEDGKRFKTRSGETVRLVDLLDAAKDRMAEQLEQRLEEGKTPLTREEIPEAAQKIGYGAVKYFDLRQNPVTNYVFSYDRMLDTRGDTAVYLLFAHARLASIIRKAEEEKSVNMDEVRANGEIILKHAAERALAFELLQFGDVIHTVLKHLMPNKICEYLRDLAAKFTEFVTQCKVLDSPEQNSRLLLCDATGVVMRQLFNFLGIAPLYKI